MSDDKRPFISIDPARKFGLPTLNGTRLTVESVAACVWDGWDLAKLQTDGWPELRRSDVLVCCWFVGKNGSRTWRKRWGAWAKDVQPHLWSASTVDYEAVSWPPTWQTQAAKTPALPTHCQDCNEPISNSHPLTRWCLSCDARRSLPGGRFGGEGQ